MTGLSEVDSIGHFSQSRLWPSLRLSLLYFCPKAKRCATCLGTTRIAAVFVFADKMMIQLPFISLQKCLSLVKIATVASNQKENKCFFSS